MDTRTGKIVYEDSMISELFRRKIESGELVSVSEEDMTEKQKADHQVSKHDNRSTLGRQFAENRKQRRAEEREMMRQICKSKRRKTNNGG